MKAFFIPGNVPSSKNSRNSVSYVDKVTGQKKTLVIAAKAVQKYRANTSPFWSINKHDFKKAVATLSKPYYVGFYFIRGSRHLWDKINPEQTVQDEMKKHGWIEDDDVANLCPCPLFMNGEFWTYNKEYPGVLIVVFDNIEQIGQSHDPYDIMRALVRKNDLKYFKNVFNKPISLQ